MQQVFFTGGFAPSTSATNYFESSYGSGSSTTEVTQQQVITTPGTISNLYAKVSVAPGSPDDGKSFAITVRKTTVGGSAASTTLTVTILDAATTASDTVNSFSVVAGDMIEIMSVPSGTPAATKLYTSLLFTGSNANESNILGTSVYDLTTGTTEYMNLACGSNIDWNSTETNRCQVVPTSGTIKNLYVELSGSPGAGKSYAFTVYKNGSPTALTTTISETNVRNNDSSHSFTVAVGDLLSIEYIPSGTPTVRTAKWGCTFVADTDGESVLLGGSDADLNETNNRVATLQVWGWDLDTSEPADQHLGQASTLKSLYVNVATAVAASASITFTSRVNTGAGNQTVTLSAGETDKQDTTNSDVLASDFTALVNYRRSAHTGTPGNINPIRMGMVCYVAPTGGATGFMTTNTRYWGT